MPTKDIPIVTEGRVLDVLARLKDMHDHGLPPSRELAQDARECLAYLHGAVLRHGPGFVVQDEEPAHHETAPRMPHEYADVDKMSEGQAKSLLKGIQEDVRAGVWQESSEDIGDMVLDRMAKAGLCVEGVSPEDDAPSEGP